MIRKSGLFGSADQNVNQGHEQRRVKRSTTKVQNLRKNAVRGCGRWNNEDEKGSKKMHKHLTSPSTAKLKRVTEVRKGAIQWRNGHSGHTNAADTVHNEHPSVGRYTHREFALHKKELQQGEDWLYEMHFALRWCGVVLPLQDVARLTGPADMETLSTRLNCYLHMPHLLGNYNSRVRTERKLREYC